MRMLPDPGLRSKPLKMDCEASKSRLCQSENKPVFLSVRFLWVTTVSKSHFAKERPKAAQSKTDENLISQSE